MTSYIGSLLINSGRMSLSAGVSMRGWKPGLSPFMMSPIADYIECQPGLWHVIRDRRGSWTGDVFGLIHSDETHVSSTFMPVREIISFQTWGRLRVGDTCYPKNKHQRCVFDIHPDKWGLVACMGKDSPNLMKWPEQTKFFLIQKLSPQNTSENHTPIHVGPLKDY